MLSLLAVALLQAAPEDHVGQPFPDLEPWHTSEALLAPERALPHSKFLVRPGAINVITFGRSNECGPCIRARGSIRRLSAKHPDVQFSVLYEARPFELREALKLDALPNCVRVVYGPGVTRIAKQLDIQSDPTTWVLDANGKVIHVEHGWEKLESTFSKFLEGLVPKGTSGGMPEAVRKERQALLKSALADEALLAVPSAEQARTALLKRAIPALESDLKALETAVGGLPPAELLRFAAHYRNALDRARAGPAAAFAPLPAELSPLGQDRLERRVLLYAGRGTSAKKPALVTPVTLTLSGNRRQVVNLVTSGQIVDADPKNARLETVWHVLASPELRKTWVSGNDLRLSWVRSTEGVPPGEPPYDAVRAGRVREIAELMQPRQLFESPLSLAPGDLLVHSLPWHGTSAVFVVRTASNSELKATVDGDGVDQLGVDSGELVSRDFMLSVDPANKPNRRVRPGLYWLRPRVPKEADARRLLRPLSFPSNNFPWRDAPSVPALPVTNGGREPLEIVRTFVERAGAGYYFAGMPLDERLALTTFVSPPRSLERLRLARGYTLVAPRVIEGDQVAISVVYSGGTQRIDANGGQYGNESGGDFEVKLTRTVDGWKISGQPFLPDVMLLERSRWTPEIPKTDGDDGLRLGRVQLWHGRPDEALASFEGAAAASPQDPEPALAAARAAAALDRTDEALRWLTTAADRGFKVPRTLETDKDLEKVRSAPGFTSIVTRVRATACDELAAKKSTLLAEASRDADRTDAGVQAVTALAATARKASEAELKQLAPRFAEFNDGLAMLDERRRGRDKQLREVETMLAQTCTQQ